MLQLHQASCLQLGEQGNGMGKTHQHTEHKCFKCVESLGSYKNLNKMHH